MTKTHCPLITLSTNTTCGKQLELLRKVLNFLYQPFNHLGDGLHFISNIVTDKHLNRKMLNIISNPGFSTAPACLVS